MNEFDNQQPPEQPIPPQFGQEPPQYGQMPPQYGQVPPQYGQQQPNMRPYAPPEVCRWNWGAFMFNILYGIGNKSYLPLLCFIPIFNIAWVFVCGACGMRWAWEAGLEKGEYRPDELHIFLRVQRTWNTAGFVYFWIYVAIMVIYIIVLAFSVNTMLNPFNYYY